MEDPDALQFQNARVYWKNNVATKALDLICKYRVAIIQDVKKCSLPLKRNKTGEENLCANILRW